MNYKLFLMAPAIFMLTNCKTKAQNDVQKNGMMTIGINKTITLPDSKVKVSFSRVAEESRCPVDVTCVWEGIAVVDLKLVNGAETKTVELATRDFEPKNVKRNVLFGGYNISLEDLKPYPGGNQEPEIIVLKYQKQ